MVDAADRAKQLRAVAYGPGNQSAAERATAAARLRDLEPQVGAEDSAPAESSAESVPVAAVTDDRRPRRRFALLALAAVTLVAVVASVATALKPIDSLAVFDRPDTAGVEVPETLAASQRGNEAEFRLLVEYEQYQVWAMRAPSQTMDLEGNLVPGDGVEVCLTVIAARGHSSGSCADEAGFRRTGLQLGNFDVSTDPDGTAHQVRFAWGPTGDVRPIHKIVPPKPTFDELMDREPTERDIDGRAALVSTDERAADTLRWVADYGDYGVWLYRRSGAVCLLVANPEDAISDMASDCVLREEFEAEGIALPWPPDDVVIKLSPELGLRIARS